MDNSSSIYNNLLTIDSVTSKISKHILKNLDRRNHLNFLSCMVNITADCVVVQLRIRIRSEENCLQHIVDICGELGTYTSVPVGNVEVSDISEYSRIQPLFTYNMILQVSLENFKAYIAYYTITNPACLLITSSAKYYE